MTTWITEQDYRQSKAREMGIGINVAFLQEIKEDHVEFRALLHETNDRVFAVVATIPNVDNLREVYDLLSRLRDELETYFALEEFYGGMSFVDESSDLSRQALQLKQEHIDLFLQMEDIVETVERMVYHELPIDRISTLESKYQSFVQALKHHESKEMELVMRQCNEDLGGGD